MSPTKSLVIVESPHKATMIAGYLGPKYTVRASQGHVRDLPTSASEVPAKYKGSHGRVPESTSITSSPRSTSFPQKSGRRFANSRACSRTLTSSCSLPMVTARGGHRLAFA